MLNVSLRRLRSHWLRFFILSISCATVKSSRVWIKGCNLQFCTGRGEFAYLDLLSSQTRPHCLPHFLPGYPQLEFYFSNYDLKCLGFYTWVSPQYQLSSYKYTKTKADSCLAQLLFSQNTSWRRDSAGGIAKICGAGVVGSTPTASTNKGNYT